MNKEQITFEIIKEEKIKDQFFYRHENALLVFLSVSFALLASFFVQSWFLVDGEKFLETGFITYLIWGSFIGMVIIFLLIKWIIEGHQRVVEKSHRKIEGLLQQYLDELNKEEKSKK